jgi:Uma2 family endonuclease
MAMSLRDITSPDQLPRHGWTAAAVRKLPRDGNRYECIDGVLHVSPPPRIDHERVGRELFIQLYHYVERHNIGEVWLAQGELTLDPRTRVIPDIFFTPGYPPRRTKWKDMRHVDLAIEILSPSSEEWDRVVKRDRYRRYGIAEYWIVDADLRTVERWTPTATRAELVTESTVWTPRAGVPPYVVDWPTVFAAGLDAFGPPVSDATEP